MEQKNNTLSPKEVNHHYLTQAYCKAALAYYDNIINSEHVAPEPEKLYGLFVSLEQLFFVCDSDETDQLLTVLINLYENHRKELSTLEDYVDNRLEQLTMAYDTSLREKVSSKQFIKAARIWHDLSDPFHPNKRICYLYQFYCPEQVHDLKMAAQFNDYRAICAYGDTLSSGERLSFFREKREQLQMLLDQLSERESKTFLTEIFRLSGIRGLGSKRLTETLYRAVTLQYETVIGKLAEQMQALKDELDSEHKRQLRSDVADISHQISGVAGQVERLQHTAEAGFLSLHHRLDCFEGARNASSRALLGKLDENLLAVKNCEEKLSRTKLDIIDALSRERTASTDEIKDTLDHAFKSYELSMSALMREQAENQAQLLRQWDDRQINAVMLGTDNPALEGGTTLRNRVEVLAQKLKTTPNAFGKNIPCEGVHVFTHQCVTSATLLMEILQKNRIEELPALTYNFLCNPISSALENELKINFFYGFMDWVEEPAQCGPFEENVETWPEILVDRSSMPAVRGNNFTIGTFVYKYAYYNNHKLKGKDRKTYVSFEKYMKDTFGYSLSKSNTRWNSVINNPFRHVLDIRNDSSHTDVVPFSAARQYFELVLGELTQDGIPAFGTDTAFGQLTDIIGSARIYEYKNIEINHGLPAAKK